MSCERKDKEEKGSCGRNMVLKKLLDLSEFYDV